MNKFVSLLFTIGTITALDSSSSSSESDDFLDSFHLSDHDYFSPEAKDTAAKLEKYLSSKTVELESILDELEKDNSAVEALNNYHKNVKQAEDTVCKVETPKGLANAEDTIKSSADACSDSVSIDDFKSLADAVDKTFYEIENIDKRLRENDKSCSSEDTSDCAYDKKKTIEELNTVLSPTVFAHFDMLIYSEAKEALDVCLQIINEDLHHELDLHTKKIEECLTSL